MIPLPLSLKLLVPGYRTGWRARSACMLHEMAMLSSDLTFGADGEVPWIELRDSHIRLYGFWTEPKNEEIFRILQGALPAGIPRRHFRLVKDCLNRYVYPHMRPDMKPSGFSVDQMFGLHGQHKDAVDDLEDEAARTTLRAAFRPKPDDVIIDCGAFLGFGDLRMARDISEGRIIAVEADRTCHGLLVRNLTHNAVTNVMPMHRAVWNEDTELDLQSSFAQANTLVAEVHHGDQTERVRTISIDQIVEEQRLQKVDMLSLTLNGAEVEALDGAERTLADLRPRIRLAGWYERQGRKIWSITKEQLERHRYRVFVGKRGNTMALPE